jgi:hypothetical protein
MRPTDKENTLRFEVSIFFGILMIVCSIVSFSKNWVLVGHINILCAILDFIDAHLTWCRKGGNDGI